MKKFLVILLCFIMCFAMYSCKEKDGESDMKKSKETKPNKTISVTFINDVIEADIWVLPQTEKNLKSTVWGTATISKLNAGDKMTVDINADEDIKEYIVRIIDVDHAYYAANDFTLDDNYTIRFKTDDTKYESVIESLDQNGKTMSSTKAFKGVLGAN